LQWRGGADYNDLRGREKIMARAVMSMDWRGWAVRSAAVAVWTVAGCGGLPRPSLSSSDPAARTEAIIRAAEARDTSAIPLLIDRLEDDDSAVRAIAIIGLRKLTGQDFDYRAYDPLYLRMEAVGRWRKWLKEHGPAEVKGEAGPEARSEGSGKSWWQRVKFGK